MATIRLEYRGHNVSIQAPLSKDFTGKYTITVGNLVRAKLVVKKIGKKRLRIFWDKDYGPTLRRLLRGAFNQFVNEIMERN